MRESLETLVRAGGWRVATFASAREFLGAPGVEGPSCLVLDVGLPEISGLELQEQLAAVARAVPSSSSPGAKTCRRPYAP